ncbi:MAG TPA: hypothetical protein VK335_00100 [Bryobacteraceae bacterium]|nr:hypothetical protein [Bryobacteraceae bacterium]
MLVPAVYPSASAIRRAPRLLVPSLSDCLFLAILLWGFAAGSGWSVLLADGDTGWHIRTGEYILRTHSVPTRDLFSFSKASQPWFAWEWLSDVTFAVLHHFWGLKGVVVFTGLVLSLAATLLFRYAVWRGANVLVALVATLLATGASTVHYLARPHIFTILGLTVALWILERDRRRPTRAVWWLVPGTAVWTNLHGGFLAAIACLALVTAGAAWKVMLDPPEARRFEAVRRYGLLTGACALATLANPYGWRLHQHLASYLTSGWIRDAVEEFQSPRFRSESMLQFEILLFGGVLLVPVLLRQRQTGDLLAILFWAHAALVSARHVPLYAIVAAPICAEAASRWWAEWSASFKGRSIGGTLRDCLRDFSAEPQRSSLWPPVILLSLSLYPWSGPRDFPDNKFPVTAVQRNADLIAPAVGSQPRILTSDQWGDYLIYHFYPKGRVFVDGRSDFYGPAIGRQYLDLLNAAPNWESTVDAFGFDVALLPLEWPVAQVLMRHPNWRVRYLDRQAILLERRGHVGLNQKPDSTERIHEE